MLPARRFNGQYGLTDLFNDFFDNRSLEKVEFTTPAINVKENDTEYKIEVAAPGACKDDFKIHLNRDGNLVIEMEKQDKCCCKGKEEEKKECKYLRKSFHTRNSLRHSFFLTMQTEKTLTPKSLMES